MHEAPTPLERIRLPVEGEVWGMFTSALPQGLELGSIVLVGDYGKGTLADLASKTFPRMRITIVDRSPVVIEELRPKAKEDGWSVFTGDITDPRTIAALVKKTSGGAEAVFMKHGVHLNPPRDQEKVIASLFRLSRRGGIIGWSVPTVLVGSLARPQNAFVDTTIRHDILHSTVYIGRNTPPRRLRAFDVPGVSR